MSAIFRHWDPRVLAPLMPTLDEAQFARVLDQAAEVAFWAADHGGCRRVVADPVWPSASPGLLTITSHQAVALNNRRLAASHRRIAACLAELGPDVAARITNEQMLTHVAISDRTGRDLGIASEVAHGD